MSCKYSLPVCGLSSNSFGIVLNFNEVLLINSLFRVFPFGVVSKESPPCPRSYRFFPPMLSIQFLCFKFRFVIHFELIYVNGLVKLFFFSLHRDVQLFQHHLWKTVVPAPFVENCFMLLPLFICKRSVDFHLCGSVSGLSVLFR